MRIFIIALTFVTLSLATPSYAERENHAAKVANHNGSVVHVTVNGLVCDFCARALEKIFSRQESVSDIDVNLDSKIITINFKKGQMLDDKTITNLILDSGYDVRDISHVK